MANTISAVDQVQFYIDDTSLSGSPIRIENNAPFDLGGTSRGNPNAFDTNTLSDGAHTLSLRILFSDGSAGTGTVSFNVDNSEANTNSNSRLVQMIKRNSSRFAIDGQSGAATKQNIYLWSDDENNVNQHWIEIDRGNGYYTYQKQNTEFCIDGGVGGGRANNVFLIECRDSNQNQHWRKVDVGAGNFRLEKRNSPGFSIDGGRRGGRRQNVYLWSSDDDNQNQHWTFNYLD